MSRYELWRLFGPSTWALWCLLAAAAALAAGGPRGIRLGRRAAFAGAALALATMALPTGAWLIEPLETRFPAVSLTAVRADDIVVLAGAERLGPAFRRAQPSFSEHGERVLEGAMLARAQPSARLWAVGGIRRRAGGPYDVDWDIAAWTALGLPRDRIVRVADTADTCANAAGLKRRLAPGRRVALVTSAFHMPRSVACFRAAGLEPIPFPVDFQNGPLRARDLYSPDVVDNLRRFDLALHEYVGLALYRVTGRIAELWPAPKAASGEHLPETRSHARSP